MSDFWNPPKRTEEEWDKLPPLVAKGEDRAKKLAEIVEKWCTPSPAGEATTAEAHAAAKGFILDGIDLVDANINPPQPVDLGELLRSAEEKLRLDGVPTEFAARPDLHIVLRACRVRVCLAGGREIRPRWTAVGSRFEHNIHFGRATFGDYSSFDFARFDDMAFFDSATFGDRATFKSATFKRRTRFDQARFGDETRFNFATFGHPTSFSFAIFGERASFDSAIFWHDANFAGTIFHGKAAFFSSTFGDSASFDGAHFGDEARFSGATFGDGAFFANTNFGDDTSFIDTIFGNWIEFYSATFGRGASFASAAFGPNANLLNTRFGPGGGLGKIVVASNVRRVRRMLGLPPWKLRVLASLRRFGSPLDTLERVRRRLVLKVDWNLVRVAGESAILNRASMLAIILVPLVAGAWPAVYSLMLGYAFGVKGGVAMYDAARTSLLLEASRIPGAETVPEIVSKLDAQVSTIADQLQRAASQEYPLPVGWGLLFFGALAVVLGKTFYGWGAPESVKERSREEAMAADTAEYRERAPHRRLLLSRAITRLQDAARTFPEVRHPSFVARREGAVWVPKSMEEFEEYEAIWKKDQEAMKEAHKRFESGADPLKAWKPERPPLAETPETLAIILIDEGAAAQYDLDAREAPIRMNITTFLYATGLYCIAWLLVHQATAILKQSHATWWYLPDYWSVGLRMLIIGWWAVSFVVALPWMMGKMKRLFA